MQFDAKIIDYLELKKVPGKVYGVEIEMEGNKGGFPTALPKEMNFRAAPDNSLRPNSIEYVSIVPKKKEELKQDIELLHSALAALDCLPVDSPRAGVHIHINMQDNTFLELLTFLTVYYVLENSLIRNCGKGRVGNLFCLRLEDAMTIKDTLILAAINKNISSLNSKGHYRYSAMNMDALFQYGSLEFRALRTPTDIRTIGVWLDIFSQLQDAAKTFKDPSEVIDKVSALGYQGFVNKVLGKHAPFINPLYLPDDMQSCVWNIQSFAFSSNWK